MDSDENSQVSASKTWLTLAELPCNWLWIRANSIAVHAARVSLMGTYAESGPTQFDDFRYYF